VVDHGVRKIGRVRSGVAIAGAEVLANGLADDPLFCDLLANLHLHLEHEVHIDRVVEIRRTIAAAAIALADAIERALPALGRSGAFDMLIAAYSLAAAFWQIANPRSGSPTSMPRSPRPSRRSGTSISRPRSIDCSRYVYWPRVRIAASTRDREREVNQAWSLADSAFRAAPRQGRWCV